MPLPLLMTLAKLAPIVYGAVETAQGNKEYKEAQKLRPPNTDPTEANLAATVDEIRKGYRTGAVYSDAIRQIRQQHVDAMVEAGKSAGGNSAAVMEAIRSLNEHEGNQTGEIFTRGEQGKQYYDTQYASVIENMVKRRADLQANDYANAMAKAWAKWNAGKQTVTTGVADVLPDIAAAGDDALNAMIYNMKAKNFGKKQASEAPTMMTLPAENSPTMLPTTFGGAYNDVIPPLPIPDLPLIQ